MKHRFLKIIEFWVFNPKESNILKCLNVRWISLQILPSADSFWQSVFLIAHPATLRLCHHISFLFPFFFDYLSHCSLPTYILFFCLFLYILKNYCQTGKVNFSLNVHYPDTQILNLNTDNLWWMTFFMWRSRFTEWFRSWSEYVRNVADDCG